MPDRRVVHAVLIAAAITVLSVVPAAAHPPDQHDAQLVPASALTTFGIDRATVISEPIACEDGSAAIRYGQFLNAVITFVVVGFVVWQISKTFIREEPTADLKDCVYCLEKIAAAATRCRACGSQL